MFDERLNLRASRLAKLLSRPGREGDANGIAAVGPRFNSWDGDVRQDQ
jgi:hypothetical protein